MGALDGLFNEATKEYVKFNEGYNPSVYKDTKGINTAGYGFNLKAEHIKKYIPKDVINGKRNLTQEESESIFNNVYSNAVNDAKKYVSPEVYSKLNPGAQQALIDMSYNMGLTRLNKFKDMKAALVSGDYDTAGKELLNSKYAREDVPNRANKNYFLLTGKTADSLNNMFNQGDK